jgi:hypothetical protein
LDKNVVEEWLEVSDVPGASPDDEPMTMKDPESSAKNDGWKIYFNIRINVSTIAYLIP